MLNNDWSILSIVCSVNSFNLEIKRKTNFNNHSYTSFSKCKISSFHHTILLRIENNGKFWAIPFPSQKLYRVWLRNSVPWSLRSCLTLRAYNTSHCFIKDIISSASSFLLHRNITQLNLENSSTITSFCFYSSRFNRNMAKKVCMQKMEWSSDRWTLLMIEGRLSLISFFTHWAQFIPYKSHLLEPSYKLVI